MARHAPELVAGIDRNTHFNLSMHIDNSLTQELTSLTHAAGISTAIPIWCCSD
jgi:hypothetical protein